MSNRMLIVYSNAERMIRFDADSETTLISTPAGRKTVQAEAPTPVARDFVRRLMNTGWERNEAAEAMLASDDQAGTQPCE